MTKVMEALLEAAEAMVVSMVDLAVMVLQLTLEFQPFKDLGGGLAVDDAFLAVVLWPVLRGLLLSQTGGFLSKMAARDMHTTQLHSLNTHSLFLSFFLCNK